MRIAELSQQRLAHLMKRFPAARIAVVGDFFLDKYLYVDRSLEELSVETGKPAHQVVEVRTAPGAAGTVISNLAAMGAGTLVAVGMTGDDGEGFELRKGLDRLNCSTDYLHKVHDRHTPTYLKPRDVHDSSLAGEHSRYDTKNRYATSAETQEKIIASIDSLLPELDAIVVMDQVDEEDCGVVTGVVREALAHRAQTCPDVVFWADSRRNIRRFRHVIIKPNQFEAVGHDSPGPDDEVELARLRIAVEKLRQQNGATVVATRGPSGMVIRDTDWTLVPGVKVAGEIDPTGAGDSVSAGAVMALCAGAELSEAVVVGNLVASITVRQIATTGFARPEQLPERLSLWHKQCGRRS